jgi:hypothetical protein
MECNYKKCTRHDQRRSPGRFSYVCKVKVQVLNIHFQLETNYRSITINVFNFEFKKAPTNRKPKLSRDPDITKGELQAN